jgi:hypothetical protein
MPAAIVLLEVGAVTGHGNLRAFAKARLDAPDWPLLPLSETA